MPDEAFVYLILKIHIPEYYEGEPEVQVIHSTLSRESADQALKWAKRFDPRPETLKSICVQLE